MFLHHLKYLNHFFSNSVSFKMEKIEKYKTQCLVPECIYKLNSTTLATTTYICSLYNIEIHGQTWNKIKHEKFDVGEAVITRHVVSETVVPGTICIPVHDVLLDKA